MADQYFSEGQNQSREILFQELNIKSYHLQIHMLFRWDLEFSIGAERG